MTDVKPPAKAPCVSCPYRRDVPSGVWDPSEYAKLPDFDGETWEQPPSVFLCHQGDGRMCAGWCGTHDMNESLGLRVLAASQPEVAEAALDYECPVPLFDSGAEAAEHGLREVDAPPEQAIKVIERLSRKL